MILMFFSFPQMLVLAILRIMRQTKISIVFRKKEVVKTVVSLVVAMTLVVVTFKRQRRAKLGFKPYKRKRKRFEKAWG